MHLIPGDLWSYLDISNTVAHQVRDLLLGHQSWPAPREYWGSALWPFTRSTSPATVAPHPGRRPGRAHVMVVGCGSVGSEAVRLLAGRRLDWTIVDGGTVSIYNLMRQWYGAPDLGRPKVEALAERLAPATKVRTVKAMFHEQQLGQLEALLDRQRPDLVLLATGTADHGDLARLLWQRKVPHLAACAYPQARFFEVNAVLPGENTPCLHCFRGHLFRGAQSAPPMSDELGRFLYQELDPEQRRRAYVDLVAEPATAIATARIAEVLARCAVEVLTPPPARGCWFRRMLDHGTTCLLGGNEVEVLESGEASYGLSYAGQVVRLGLEDVAGTAAEHICPVCGRHLEVRHRLKLPEVDAAAVDEALTAGTATLTD